MEYENNVENITDFGIRALYFFAKHVFTRLTKNEQVVINELFTIISRTSGSLDELIINNKDMFKNVYEILNPQVDLTPTLTNYAGIVLGKMEDILFPTDEY